MNYLLNALYFIQSGVISFLWFVYSERIQRSRLVATWRNTIFCAIPLMLLTVLTICSYWTGWLFYIDSLNTYHRGNLYFFQVLIAYGYMLFTAAKAFQLSRRKENYAERSRFRTLSSFAIPPAIFGMLQTLMPGVPLLCVGNTLAVLDVYFSFQEQLISVDALTQLNNRNQLLKYLSAKMPQYSADSFDASASKHLYLLIMDVDYFKKINDRFGHVEGDLALMRVADALKRVCADQNYFIARYGGDEFILLCELSDDAFVVALCEKIQETLSMANSGSNVPYSLSLSIGFAACTADIHSIQDFIGAADEELYRVKQARH